LIKIQQAIKTLEKTEGKSRMDNPETLATLGTQDEDKQKQNTQHRKLKELATRTPPKTGGEPKCSRRIRSSCLL
jgi:hypothetical protein